MAWEVEYTNEFGLWWTILTADEQESVSAAVGLIESLGPHIPFPYGSGVEGSRHGRMRELRVQDEGRPYRVFHAFDPRRMAILLIGGDKTGDKLFHERMVPMADRLYDEHLETLRGEGPL